MEPEMLVVYWEGRWRTPAGFVRLPSSVDVDLGALRMMIDEQVEAIAIERARSGSLWDYRFLLASPSQRKATITDQMEQGIATKATLVPVSRRQEGDITISDLLFSPSAVCHPNASSPALVLRPCRKDLDSYLDRQKRDRTCNFCAYGFILLSFFCAASLAWMAINMEDERPLFRHAHLQPIEGGMDLPASQQVGYQGQVLPIDNIEPPIEWQGQSSVTSSAAVFEIGVSDSGEAASASSDDMTFDSSSPTDADNSIELMPGSIVEQPVPIVVWPPLSDSGFGMVRVDPFLPLSPSAPGAPGTNEWRIGHCHGKAWVKPLFALMESIVYTVRVSVEGYFVTFRDCWNATGSWLVTLIAAYIQFLMFMVDRMLQWPTIAVLVVAVAIALHYATKMIKIVIPYKVAKLGLNPVNADTESSGEETSLSDDEGDDDEDNETKIGKV